MTKVAIARFEDFGGSLAVFPPRSRDVWIDRGIDGDGHPNSCRSDLRSGSLTRATLVLIKFQRHRPTHAASCRHPQNGDGRPIDTRGISSKGCLGPHRHRSILAIPQDYLGAPTVRIGVRIEVGQRRDHFRVNRPCVTAHRCPGTAPAGDSRRIDRGTWHAAMSEGRRCIVTSLYCSWFWRGDCADETPAIEIRTIANIIVSVCRRRTGLGRSSSRQQVIRASVSTERSSRRLSLGLAAEEKMA